MRLDKIKFASLVAYITGLRPEYNLDVGHLDTLVEIDVKPVATQYVDAAAVNELLAALNMEGKLIEAIKAYRSLTGAGLKESMDAINRYRNVKDTRANEL